MITDAHPGRPLIAITVTTPLAPLKVRTCEDTTLTRSEPTTTSEEANVARLARQSGKSATRPSPRSRFSAPANNPPKLGATNRAIGCNAIRRPRS